MGRSGSVPGSVPHFFVGLNGSVQTIYLHFSRLALRNMVDGIGTTVYSYTAGNQLLTEDGPFASDTVTNTYASRLRVALALQQPTGFWTNGFAYDPARRLTNVTMSAGLFSYTYPPGSGSLQPINIL